MARKKGSGKKQKLTITDKVDATDSNGTKRNEPCCHIQKAVRHQAVKNMLPHMKSGHCKDCRGIPKVESSDIQDDSAAGSSVCICLKCGFQGCSRQCKQQHAHKHFLQQSSHTVCVNTTTWMIWCYACDDELNLDKENSNLQKTIKFIHEKLAKESKATADDSAVSLGKVKGLRNLGNTCFFNSVLQNISQTTLLMSSLDKIFTTKQTMTVGSTESPPEVTLNIKLDSSPGPLTTALKCFLDEFHSSARGIVVPSKLFGEITKKSPQFRGYRQQDSQELLRYLLDGMRVEELKRIEIAMKEAVRNMETPPTKEKLRECFRNAKTFVDELFGGTLVSTIRCTECKMKSQVYDNFLDLSLPVNNYQAKSSNALPKSVVNKQQRVNTSGDEKVNEDETDDGKEQKLSKHQKKTQARKEKKAKRAKGRNSLTPKSSNQDVNLSKLSETENGNDEINDHSCDEVEISNENEVSHHETEAMNEDNINTGHMESNKRSNKTENEIVETMSNIVVKDHDEFVLIEKQCSRIDNKESNDAEIDREGCDAAKLRSSDDVTVRLCEKFEKSVSINKDKIDEFVAGASPSQQILGGSVSAIVQNDNAEEEDVNQSGDAYVKLREDNDSINDQSFSPIKIKREYNEFVVNVNDENLHAVDEISVEEREVEDGTELDRSDVKIAAELANIVGNYKEIDNGFDDRNKENFDANRERYSTLNDDAEKGDVFKREENKCLGNGDEENESINREQDSGGNGNDDVNRDVNGIDKKSDKNESNELEQEDDEQQDTDAEDDSNMREDDSLETVGSEYQCKAGECSIMSCIYQFCSKDWLSGNNKFKCSECTKRRNESNEGKEESVFTVASKQMLLWKPSLILTLHLKRFEQVGRSLRKVNKFIEFPLNLDLSPFCHKETEVSLDGLQYSLFGIVEHSGSLQGGHYVAYVKTRTIDNKFKWYHISDSRVSEIQEEAVLKKQAYLLFYQRNSNKY